MKILLTTLLLLLYTSVFADDKIVCYLQNGSKIYEGTARLRQWGDSYITLIDSSTGKRKIIINAACTIEEP